jgi:uncharacterized protein YecE (DUF72 family)
MPPVRIGGSGWRYEPWRGVFYPRGLPQPAELRYLASIFGTVELNGSFYSLQRPESFAQWYAETPPGFVFAVKGGRYITHMKKLKDVDAALANFFASGIFNLREKLGPILWQLPPTMRYDRGRIATFLELLPPDTAAALRLARRRDARMNGRTRLAIDAERPLRHALEIRHESFLVPDFIEQLREHDVALVVAETAGKFPMPTEATADFMYLRLHGDKQLYVSGYGDKALERWAARIREWNRDRDVYCYFDNTDVKLRAPVDAQALMRKLELRPTGDGLEKSRKRRAQRSSLPGPQPVARSP